ncbi:MAG: undecaprenyl-diphosphate phosphatase [Candidatus Eiseniibacteriota bacterium]|nr:MAG: undecaprenyl-diphosphate phosphatase [Candidatus Eisenbacteria bacterium]
MDWLSALALGMVQGLTELLPVSSSGHLVLVEKALGLELSDLSFEVSVHVATALGLCLVLGKELRMMFRSVVPSGLSEGERVQGRSLILNVFVATLPAVAVGLLASEPLRAVFHDPVLTFAMLPVTGALLVATRWAPGDGRILNPRLALLIGAAQAVAILPGISRSGFTIAAALLLGVRKDEAVKFSFLLSLPAIVGGTALELSRGLSSASSAGAGALAVGSVAALVSAVVAAGALLRVVRRGKLEYFGYYCLCVGALGLALSLR